MLLWRMSSGVLPRAPASHSVCSPFFGTRRGSVMPQAGGGKLFSTRGARILRLKRSKILPVPPTPPIPLACSLIPNALPRIEVKYKDLTVEVDAAVGLSDKPSIWNSALRTFNTLLLRSHVSKKPLRVLEGVNGMLQPVRRSLEL